MKDESNNLWWDTAGQRATQPALTGPARADVVVVGAGIMGSSAARALAAAGISTAVIEAGSVGQGASSQPGGFVVPHFSVGTPAEIRDRLGEAAGPMIAMVGSSAAALFARIRELGIACDARQGGWFHPAHSQSSMARIQALARQWQEAGFPGEILDADATAARTGARGYVGSWYAPSGGTLHPLRYCRGLMDAALARGARLFEHSPVLAIEPLNGRYRVRTRSGSLEAERVIVCTNGLSTPLVPQLTAVIVPLKIQQCATESLPAAALAHLFRRGECLSDTRRNLFTYRVDVDGRLVTGALDSWGVSAASAAAVMARRLRDMLALPVPPRITHLWSGVSSLSAGRLPAILFETGGVLAATACNARGIALSYMVGETLARYVATGEPPALPILGKYHAANARLQQSLSRFYPHFAPLLDWLDARRRV
jgi:glycine/D-amino acid oxidase-like deaminating enzyme